MGPNKARGRSQSNTMSLVSISDDPESPKDKKYHASRGSSVPAYSKVTVPDQQAEEQTGCENSIEQNKDSEPIKETRPKRKNPTRRTKHRRGKKSKKAGNASKTIQDTSENVVPSNSDHFSGEQAEEQLLPPKHTEDVFQPLPDSDGNAVHSRDGVPESAPSPNKHSSSSNLSTTLGQSTRPHSPSQHDMQRIQTGPHGPAMPYGLAGPPSLLFPACPLCPNPVQLSSFYAGHSLPPYISDPCPHRHPAPCSEQKKDEWVSWPARKTCHNMTGHLVDLHDTMELLKAALEDMTRDLKATNSQVLHVSRRLEEPVRALEHVKRCFDDSASQANTHDSEFENLVHVVQVRSLQLEKIREDAQKLRGLTAQYHDTVMEQLGQLSFDGADSQDKSFSWTDAARKNVEHADAVLGDLVVRFNAFPEACSCELCQKGVRAASSSPPWPDVGECARHAAMNSDEAVQREGEIEQNLMDDHQRVPMVDETAQ